jgi:hypothetical protein
MASTTFSGPVHATNGFVLTVATVATLPAIATVPIGTTYFVTDAATNATTATADGTNWLRGDTGATIS